MKKFSLITTVVAIVLAGIMAAQGLTIVNTIAAGKAWNATNVFSGAGKITAITIAEAGASATNLSFALVDCPIVPNTGNGWYNLGNSNGGYMSASSYTTNITKILTNFGGVYLTVDGLYSNTMTISNVLYTYTNYVGGTTNGWRVLAAGTVASNGGSTTITVPSSGIPVIFGLGITNNNVGEAITVTVTYSPSL